MVVRKRCVLLCMLCAAVLMLAVAAEEAFEGYIVKLREPTMDLLSADGCASDICVVADLETAEQMVRDGTAIYFEPNYVMELLAASPSDPAYREQWTLSAIGYSALYESGYDGSGVTIAVIDSGMDLSHPDLADVRLSPYSKNCLGDGTHTDAYDRDQIGHGTFVISQIAAVTDNGEGIASVAPGAEIMVLRSVSQSTSQKFPYSGDYDSGSATVSTVSGAIRYAADHGADIINISLGITNYSSQLAEAVAYAKGRGVIVVAAVGNAGKTDPYYPAGLPDVIGVGSVSRSADGYVRSSFSEYNDTVDIVAPGGSVFGIKVYPNGDGVWYTGVSSTYCTDSGTSYACPIISGVAAIARQIDPTLDGAELLKLLAATAQDLGDGGLDTHYGYGLVDLAELLTAMEAVLSPSRVTSGSLYDRLVQYARGKDFALYSVSVDGYVPATGVSVRVAHDAATAYLYRVVGEYLLPVANAVQAGSCRWMSAGGEYILADAPLVLYGDATGDGCVTLVDAIRLLKGAIDDTVVLDRAAADVTMDAQVTVQDVLLLMKNLLA